MNKTEKNTLEDDDDSLLISAISVLDNSRWGVREKRKKRHRSKELLTPRKTASCGDKDEKLFVSDEKSPPCSSQSSSLAGSSELDVWSPIQQHYEEDLNQLLSNKKPSNHRTDMGYRSSVNILDAEPSPRPRAKLVHQIKSDGVLVVARRASSESMSSIFQTNDVQNQQFVVGLLKDATKISASSSFSATKQDEKYFMSREECHDSGERDEHDELPNITSHGHKRGLSIKGSCRRQWLRNQSKIDKRIRKADNIADSAIVPEICETSGSPEHKDDLVKNQEAETQKYYAKDNVETPYRVHDGSKRNKKPSETKMDDASIEKRGSACVKTTVEF